MTDSWSKIITQSVVVLMYADKLFKTIILQTGNIKKT